MSDLQVYSFVLSLIVFILLAGVFTFLIFLIMKMGIALIRNGAEDENIIEERKKVKKKTALNYVERVVSILLCVLFIGFFSFSIYQTANEDVYRKNTPTLLVVKSGSMSEKNPVNTYLEENSLNDQIDTFDLVLTYQVPPEEELKVFDVIVYETDGILVIHRIINIEPPNELHPEEYWFTCKGDAMERIDRFPVRYNQIKGIYRGEKVPFVGSLICFMQSPAGWLCILLVVLSMGASIFIERKIEKEKNIRFEQINPDKEE